MIKQAIQNTKEWLERLRKENAAQFPKRQTSTYTVKHKQRTFVIKCDNCEWENLIASRERYDALKAGRFACTSCGAIFTKERKNNG